MRLTQTVLDRWFFIASYLLLLTSLALVLLHVQTKMREFLVCFIFEETKEMRI